MSWRSASSWTTSRCSLRSTQHQSGATAVTRHVRRPGMPRRFPSVGEPMPGSSSMGSSAALLALATRVATRAPTFLRSWRTSPCWSPSACRRSTAGFNRSRRAQWPASPIRPPCCDAGQARRRAPCEHRSAAASSRRCGGGFEPRPCFECWVDWHGLPAWPGQASPTFTTRQKRQPADFPSATSASKPASAADSAWSISAAWCAALRNMLWRGWK